MGKKLLFLLYLVLLAGVFPACGDDNDYQIIDTKSETYDPKELDGLKYQLLSNQTEGSEKPILVIYLHSHNGSGNDNQKQLKQQCVKKMTEYLADKKIPAWFLVPQCPSDHEWIENRGTPGCKDKVVALITDFIKNNPVDTDRIYICGASMGAWGTWTILKENPDLFAAGFIASGMPKNVTAEDFKTIPLYVTAGTNDNAYSTLVDFTTRIKEAGGTVEFTILPGLDHPNACDNAFTPDRLDWLFKWKKGNN